jgi:hypothetical protein
LAHTPINVFWAHFISTTNYPNPKTCLISDDGALSAASGAQTVYIDGGVLKINYFVGDFAPSETAIIKLLYSY